MGQSAAICRISEDNFDLLKKSKNRKEYRLSELSKDYLIFQGSFMGIEFILAKNQDDETKRILFEIFYPSDSLGKEELENLENFDKYDFIESGNYLPFLDNSKIVTISNIIQNITEKDITERYSSTELNFNGIYPSGAWHDDNSENKVFNLRQMIEDIAELKKIFKLADENQDYLLVSVG
jgi:Domain of unknown function (DUF1877)